MKKELKTMSKSITITYINLNDWQRSIDKTGFENNVSKSFFFCLKKY